MLPGEISMILDLVEEQTELHVRDKVVQFFRLRLFKDCYDLLLFPQNEPLIYIIVDGRWQKELIDVRQAGVDGLQLFLYRHPQRAQLVERAGHRDTPANARNVNPPPYFSPVDVSVPSMHGISHKYHTEESQRWVPPPKCEGTVLGKEECRGEQHRKDGPEPILEFLSMMKTTAFVRHEEVHTV